MRKCLACLVKTHVNYGHFPKTWDLGARVNFPLTRKKMIFDPCHHKKEPGLRAVFFAHEREKNGWKKIEI